MTEKGNACLQKTSGENVEQEITHQQETLHQSIIKTIKELFIKKYGWQTQADYDYGFELIDHDLERRFSIIVKELQYK